MRALTAALGHARARGQVSCGDGAVCPAGDTLLRLLLGLSQQQNSRISFPTHPEAATLSTALNLGLIAGTVWPVQALGLGSECPQNDNRPVVSVCLSIVPYSSSFKLTSSRSSKPSLCL